MEEKFCKFCGAKIPADAVVCSSCGRQVEASSAGTQTKAKRNTFLQHFADIRADIRLWAIVFIIIAICPILYRICQATHQACKSYKGIFGIAPNALSILWNVVLPNLSSVFPKKVIMECLVSFVMACILFVWAVILCLIVRRGGRQVNKWLAFLFCFFYGWLGLHRFYEGKIGEGIVCIIFIALLCVVIPSWSWWGGSLFGIIPWVVIRAGGILAEMFMYARKPKLYIPTE